MGCHHGTDHVQYWHLAVTSQWPSSRRLKLWRICYIRQHKTNPRVCQIWTSGEDGTGCILWLVLDAISCVTWLIYRSHCKEGRGSNFLTAFTYSGQSNLKLYARKIITYQTPQSNLPIGSGNGLVPSGSKPLPEPMLIQNSVTIWRH